MDGAAYTELTQGYLPEGSAWPRDPGAMLTKIISVIGDELARVDLRGDQLLNEFDPRTALELLPEWEEMVGEPDPCSGPAATLKERRARVHAKLIARGGQSPAYFISLAASLGYTVEIEQYRPAYADMLAVGEPLWEEPAAFYWTVVVIDADDGVTYFYADESAADEPLASWGSTILECTIERFQPAHTDVAFAYRTPEEMLAGNHADFTAGQEFSTWPRLDRRPREAFMAGIHADFATGTETFWQTGY